MKNLYKLVIQQLEITDENKYMIIKVNHINNLQEWYALPEGALQCILIGSLHQDFFMKK